MSLSDRPLVKVGIGSIECRTPLTQQGPVTPHQSKDGGGQRCKTGGLSCRPTRQTRAKGLSERLISKLKEIL